MMFPPILMLLPMLRGSWLSPPREFPHHLLRPPTDDESTSSGHSKFQDPRARSQTQYGGGQAKQLPRIYDLEPAMINKSSRSLERNEAHGTLRGNFPPSSPVLRNNLVPFIPHLSRSEE